MLSASNLVKLKGKIPADPFQALTTTYQGQIIRKAPSHQRCPLQKDKTYRKVLTEKSEKDLDQAKHSKTMKWAIKNSASDFKRVIPSEPSCNFSTKICLTSNNDKIKRVKKPTVQIQKMRTETGCIIKNFDKRSQLHEQKSTLNKTHKQNMNKPKDPKKIMNSYIKYRLKTEGTVDSTPPYLQASDIEIIALIGQGTFGKVFKGYVRKTNQFVAVKRVFQDPKYKNREVEIVNMLKGDFLMNVLSTFTTLEEGSQYLNIVMEFYDGDLFSYITQQGLKGLSTTEIKLISYQVFRGLMEVHALNIAHRDIKPHNLLYKGKRVVICDFGSAKVLTHEPNLPYICSRCYRAPQLIFGATHYTSMVDIWSVGCVILEMIYGTPLFIGDSSIDHLIEIIKILGTPTKSQVVDMNPDYDLNDYKFPKIKKKEWSKIFPKADPLLLDFLSQIMIYSPKERLNAAEAIAHQFFDELREKEVAQGIQKKYGIDLFLFSREELRGNQHLIPKIIPAWVQPISTSPFC